MNMKTTDSRSVATVPGLKFGCGATAIRRKSAGTVQIMALWKNRATVITVLFNPVYRGKVTFDGIEYEGQHERIMSDETYIKLLEQKALRANGSSI